MITSDKLYKIGFKKVKVSKFDTINFDDYVYSNNGFLVAQYKGRWHHTDYVADCMGRYGFMEYKMSAFKELKTISDINKLFSMFDIKIKKKISLPKLKVRYTLK